MLTVERPPQFVTRFYGNLQFALDVLANRQITFIHVSMLNDPFDPYLFFETEFGESRGSFLRYIRQHHPAEFSRFKRAMTLNSWQDMMGQLGERFEFWRRGAFVFSTSAETSYSHPRDNLYMWGHYANGHRGVALEFRSRQLAKSVILHHESLNNSNFNSGEPWARIAYTKSFQAVSSEMYYEFLINEVNRANGAPATEDTALERHYRMTGRVKSDVWSSEAEWRLMWHNNDTRMKIYRCPISQESLVSVTFGLNMPASARGDFQHEVKHNFPGCAIWEARKRHGDFALDFSQI